MSAAVSVSVPARVEFVHVIRSVVASVAARADFSLDEIDDLTLAADEACVMVLEASGGRGTLQVEAVPADDVLRVEVRGEASAEEWPPGHLEQGMAWQILSALADEIRFEHPDEKPVLSLVKRRRPR